MRHFCQCIEYMLLLRIERIEFSDFSFSSLFVCNGEEIWILFSFWMKICWSFSIWELQKRKGWTYFIGQIHSSLHISRLLAAHNYAVLLTQTADYHAAIYNVLLHTYTTHIQQRQCVTRAIVCTVLQLIISLKRSSVGRRSDRNS